MENKQKINIAIVVVLAVAGIAFLYLHNTMPEKDNQVVDTKKEVSFKNISAVQLADMMDDKDFILVNVHTPYIGEIAGTDDFVSFNKIKNNLDKFPSAKDAKIVVYCQSGGMSSIAARDLVELGYTNVFNLSGGMIGWEKSGYALDFISDNKF